jgi:hypothetical protein
MIDDLDPANWLGLPTPVEMWKQQAHLLMEECNLLQQSLAEQRTRLATLITMFTEADRERIRLRKELEASLLEQSRANLNASNNWKKWQGEAMAREADRAFFCEAIQRLGGDPVAVMKAGYRVELAEQYASKQAHP